MNHQAFGGGTLQAAFEEFRQRSDEWSDLDADTAVLSFVSFCESGASKAYAASPATGCPVGRVDIDGPTDRNTLAVDSARSSTGRKQIRDGRVRI